MFLPSLHLLEVPGLALHFPSRSHGRPGRRSPGRDGLPALVLVCPRSGAATPVPRGLRAAGPRHYAKPRSKKEMHCKMLSSSRLAPGQALGCLGTAERELGGRWLAARPAALLRNAAARDVSAVQPGDTGGPVTAAPGGGTRGCLTGINKGYPHAHPPALLCFVLSAAGEPMKSSAFQD